MALLIKLNFNNSIYTKVIWVIIISILVCYMGYMFGKFAWYLTN